MTQFIKEFFKLIIPVLLVVALATVAAVILRLEGSIYKTQITNEFAVVKPWKSLKHTTINDYR